MRDTIIHKFRDYIQVLWIIVGIIVIILITPMKSENKIMSEDIKTNTEAINIIKNDTSSDIQEIKFNMKSICKALEIDYISSNSE